LRLKRAHRKQGLNFSKSDVLARCRNFPEFPDFQGFSGASEKTSDFQKFSRGFSRNRAILCVVPKNRKKPHFFSQELRGFPGDVERTRDFFPKNTNFDQFTLKISNDAYHRRQGSGL
jgi:hypothetical protein